MNTPFPSHRTRPQYVLLVLALTLIISVFTLLTSCQINILGSGIIGSGIVANEQRTVGQFSTVNVAFSGDVDILCKQQTRGIQITADDNILPYVRTEVVGGTLRIYTDGIAGFTSRSRIRVQVSTDMISGVEVTGSGNTTVAQIDNTSMNILLSGSGDVRVNGSTQDLNIALSGSGDIDTRNLLATQATVRVTGSGDVRVFARQSLDATVTGSGDIYYYGNPQNVRRNVSGSGSIRAGQ